jgi:hypothetical protein
MQADAAIFFLSQKFDQFFIRLDAGAQHLNFVLGDEDGHGLRRRAGASRRQHEKHGSQNKPDVAHDDPIEGLLISNHTVMKRRNMRAFPHRQRKNQRPGLSIL